MTIKLITDLKPDLIQELLHTHEKEGHIQQAIFSVYHNAFTQICYTCMAVNTSMKASDFKK